MPFLFRACGEETGLISGPLQETNEQVVVGSFGLRTLQRKQGLESSDVTRKMDVWKASMLFSL